MESLFLVPVPKIKSPKSLDDFRPAAHSSLVIVKKEILRVTHGKLDPHQFAYGAGRGVEGAVCTLLHTVLGHLDGSKNLVRLHRPFLSF